MSLSVRQKDWLDNPDGGLLYADLRQALLDHDGTCLSLPHAWLPGRGGVSCDVGGCDDCPLVFHTNDGAVAYGMYPEPEITDDEGCTMWLCECCSRPHREAQRR